MLRDDPMAQRLPGWLAAALLSVCLGEPALAQTSRTTVQLTLDGQRLTGRPLAWSEDEVHFLARDGRWWSFAPQAASSAQALPQPFRSYSAAEFRQQLGRELGSGYQTTHTGHFVVAHPAGAGSQWSARFEELYRNAKQFFHVRGCSLTEPQFVLPAVVFRNREEFLRAAAADGTNQAGQLLGYYSLRTNRVLLYDIGDGRAEDWEENAQTIVHEALHQMAYNTGLHQRFSEQPRWLVEGLATLFEARGVWDSRRYRQLADRVNADQLATYRNNLPRRARDAVQTLVADDRGFQTDPQSAYADAWALTFFLAQTRARDFAEYLRITAARPWFSEYPAQERVRDFTQAFGGNWAVLDAHLREFLETF